MCSAVAHFLDHSLRSCIAGLPHAPASCVVPLRGRFMFGHQCTAMGIDTVGARRITLPADEAAWDARPPAATAAARCRPAGGLSGGPLEPAGRAHVGWYQRRASRLLFPNSIRPGYLYPDMYIIYLSTRRSISSRAAGYFSPAGGYLLHCTRVCACARVTTEHHGARRSACVCVRACVQVHGCSVCLFVCVPLVL